MKTEKSHNVNIFMLILSKYTSCIRLSWRYMLYGYVLHLQISMQTELWIYNNSSSDWIDYFKKRKKDRKTPTWIVNNPFELIFFLLKLKLIEN